MRRESYDDGTALLIFVAGDRRYSADTLAVVSGYHSAGQNGLETVIRSAWTVVILRRSCLLAMTGVQRCWREALIRSSMGMSRAFIDA